MTSKYRFSLKLTVPAGDLNIRRGYPLYGSELTKTGIGTMLETVA